MYNKECKNIKYILVKDLGKKIANKYIKLLESKIKKEGGKSAMVETMRALREDRKRTIMEAKDEGMQTGMIVGKLEGEKSGKIETAKNMLRENIDIDTIVRVTGLKKEDFV